MNRIARMVLRNFFRLPVYLPRLWHYAKHTDEYPEIEKWLHIHKTMKLAVEAGNIDLLVTGRENLPEQDGFVLYANHQGLFDVLALASDWDRPLAAVLKKELAEVPLLKQIRLCTHSYAMDREDVRQSLTVIKNVTEQVQKGRNFLIFPEGTRSRNGNIMGEFHGGSFRAAMKAQCPIVPLCFIDSFKVLDEKGSKPVSVQMHYLKPIPYEEYKDMKTVEVAELVKSRIQAVLDANT
jgi:1-acyl-sn-glycerol-3-phosphate acyltransferase